MRDWGNRNEKTNRRSRAWDSLGNYDVRVALILLIFSVAEIEYLDLLVEWRWERQYEDRLFNV